MALPRDEVLAGMPADLSALEELIRSLDDAEWQRPSRCEGWTAADVAGHVVGQMTDVVEGRLDGLGTPEVTQRQVDERRGRSQQDLADELARAHKATADLLPVFDDAAWASPSPGGYEGTLGDAVEALWYDAYLHADDIRHAAGRPSVASDGLRASLSHVVTELEKRGVGPATLAFDGQPRFEIGGGGETIGGDALAFVLAVTGRGDPTAFGLDASVNIYA
jgi:uncharacterized protein (TIGR03083 family)